MKIEEPEYKKGGQFSLWLHFSVIVGALLFTFFKWVFKEEPDPHVFQMVAISDFSDIPEQSTSSQIKEPAAAPQPPEKIPEPQKPIKTPPPKPVEKKVPAPTPTPTPKPVVKPAPVKVTETPKPPTKMVSYADFIKKNDVTKNERIPEPVKKTTVTKSVTPTVVPNINTSDLKNNMNNLATSKNASNSQQSPRVSADEISRYHGYVNQTLQSLWSAPAGSRFAGLKTFISFRIESDGRITSCLVAKSSGDADFDEVALRVFQRLARFNPPPGGKAQFLTQGFESL